MLIMKAQVLTEDMLQAWSLESKLKEDILHEKPVLSGDSSPLGTDDRSSIRNTDTAITEFAAEQRGKMHRNRTLVGSNTLLKGTDKFLMGSKNGRTITPI